MNPTEIAIYAIETKAIIQVLWGLLLILSITVVSVSIMYVLLRLKVRSFRRRETQLARHIAIKADEITRLELRVAEYVELESGIEELKEEIRRIDGMRDKAEERVVEQNEEMTTLRTRLTNLEGNATDATKEVRRVEAIRTKTEERLVAQNSELETLLSQVEEQTAELARLRGLVEHVELSESRGEQLSEVRSERHGDEWMGESSERPDWLAIRESARSVKKA